MLQRWRTIRDGDDGSAILMVLMAIMVASGLSILVLGMIVAQVNPTLLARKNMTTLQAAQAGLDATLSQLRNATVYDVATSQTLGDRSQLPCGDVSGTVGGVPNNPAYTVSVRYYIRDPSGQPSSWLDANKLECTGTGPALTPSFAYLSSAGVADDVKGAEGNIADRTVVTTYQFSLTNSNVLGGLVHAYDDGNGSTLSLCFDAQKNAPVDGDPAFLVTCQDGKTSQLFAYRKDLSIVLAATQKAEDGDLSGKCLTGSWPGDATVTPVTFATCNGSPSQKWGFDDSAHFRLSNPAATDLSNLCLMGQFDNVSGTPIVMSNFTGGYCGGYNRRDTWRPDATVGAGAAGPGTQQLVNYYEFGRCFDVSNQDINYAWMIDFPCKQNPNPAKVTWNQKMTYNADNNWIYTLHTPSGKNYCVTTTNAEGAYVVMTLCSQSNPAQKWTPSGDTGVYSTSYTLVDGNGRCLGVGPPRDRQRLAGAVVVDPGADLQRLGEAEVERPAEPDRVRHQGDTGDHGDRLSSGSIRPPYPHCRDVVADRGLRPARTAGRVLPQRGHPSRATGGVRRPSAVPVPGMPHRARRARQRAGAVVAGAAWPLPHLR